MLPFSYKARQHEEKKKKKRDYPLYSAVFEAGGRVGGLINKPFMVFILC